MNDPSAVDDILPYQPRTFFLEPVTSSGEYLGIDLRFDSRYTPVRGVVLRVHPTCQDVKEGDVVLFPPHTYQEVDRGDGRRFYVQDERVVRAILG